jgi:hypothetical protein
MFIVNYVIGQQEIYIWKALIKVTNGYYVTRNCVIHLIRLL